MKIHFSFILIILFAFSVSAQTSKVNRIDDAITIKPRLNLIDLSDASLSMNNLQNFKDFQFSQNIETPTEEFNMRISYIDIKRNGVLVFSSKDLKKSFFQDFNLSYNRSQLKRLLPRLPDISDFTPCF
ncbi:hypothetical protein HNV08_00375 [Winogradskyella eckloniae]|uniref:hypothetical protein n=1 Tax=Winogradskyella eckloniae TaxID=1089306 RepID=UPI0015676CAA|nr:hypothetical protein [Winogradskyella eckloniae]NRD18484.1 hypothetical protein [Winogradskyella eckloniae]